MRWKRIVAIVVVVLMGGAYLAGYLPEHRLRTEADTRGRMLEERLRLLKLALAWVSSSVRC